MHFERMIMVIKLDEWRYKEGGSHYVTCSLSTSRRIASMHISIVVHEVKTLFCHHSVIFDMIQCSDSRIPMALIDVPPMKEKNIRL
jgi:hypothetical protein